MQKTYETYKDSGIKWIGNVPSHWVSLPIKHYIGLEKGTKPADLTDENTGFPYLTMDYLRSRDGKITMYPTTIDGLNLIDENEILVLWDGANAGEFLLSKKGYIGSTMARISVDESKYDKKYFYLLLKAIEKASKDYSNGTTIPHFDSKVLSDYYYPCPPLSEQQAIAEYLDKNCNKIDALVAELEQQVTDLCTMKKAEISRVVTKGLNPNAPLKDSGIEWIGEMPIHWSKAKLKRIVELKSGNTLSPDKIHNNGEYIVYGGNGARGFINTYTNDGHYVLIGRQGALCGNINYAHGKFWATEHAVICYPKENLETMWLGEMLRTMNLNQYSLSAAQPGLSVERIRELYIVIPPLDEQRAISKHLDTYCAKVDATVKELQDQIADLKLYKQSIISEAVTGKIKVID